MAEEQEKIFDDTKDEYEQRRRVDRDREAKYRAANREILREKAKAYYANNKEEIIRKKVEYHANNREKVREQDRVRYARNREEILRRKAEKRGPPKPKKPPKLKYQAAFNVRVKEEKRYYCEVCDIACAKPNELKKHFGTKKHVRNSWDAQPRTK